MKEQQEELSGIDNGKREHSLLGLLIKYWRYFGWAKNANAPLSEDFSL